LFLPTQCGTVLVELMSDFKFACPVCGQHLTADSRISGGQIACPTCFQKIVVPQAPTVPDTKLILSAAQVGKPRPSSLEVAADLGPLRHSRPWRGPARALATVLVVAAAGALLWAGRGRLFHPNPNAHPTQDLAAARSIYPIPTNLVWTLDLTDVVIPELPAVGRIHGGGFLCEQVSLQQGKLMLRQGQGWPPDLRLSVALFARKSADLSGKTVEVNPQRSPPLPKVVMHWQDQQGRAQRQEFTSGYALRLEFGRAAEGRLPGRLYLCLPDESRSFVAGTFEAKLDSPPEPVPPQRF
jgi:predicted RNA-binding Zn-ribbon protein involved in translation (DUF1610 family)